MIVLTQERLDGIADNFADATRDETREQEAANVGNYLRDLGVDVNVDGGPEDTRGILLSTFGPDTAAVVVGIIIGLTLAREDQASD